VHLEKIEIRLLPGDRITTADAMGNFSFDNLASGEYRISLNGKTLPENVALVEPAEVAVTVAAGSQHVAQMLRLENRGLADPAAETVHVPWDTAPAAPESPESPSTVESPVAPVVDKASAPKHNLEGRKLTQLGRYREAVAEFDEAIRLQPDFALAYNARGYAWFLLHKYAAADDDFTSAIRINPNYLNAYQLRAATRKAMGNLSGAAADTQRAKELSR
jgi:tetratricopeptide (TPR) repeat protein